MIHIERVSPDPDDPRAAALAESLRAEHPDAVHEQRRHDDIVATEFVEDVNGDPLGTTSVRVPHISGTAKVNPTGRHHHDDEGPISTHHDEEDEQ